MPASVKSRGAKPRPYGAKKAARTVVLRFYNPKIQLYFFNSNLPTKQETVVTVNTINVFNGKTIKSGMIFCKNHCTNI